MATLMKIRGLAKASFSWGPAFLCPLSHEDQLSSHSGEPPMAVLDPSALTAARAAKSWVLGPAAILGLLGLPLPPSGELLGLPWGHLHPTDTPPAAPYGYPTCSTLWQRPLLQHPTAVPWTWPPLPCPHTALAAAQEMSSPTPLK